MFGSRPGLFLFVGFSFFLLSFLVMGIVPWTIAADWPELNTDQLAADGISHEFVDLAERFPDQFRRHFPNGVTTRSYAEALILGHRIYVTEACWHCHTLRTCPDTHEEGRGHSLSLAGQCRKVMEGPVLFGDQRVGPDLSREGGRRSNDWHVAHFHDPRIVVPTSVMPAYRSLFDDDGYPNKRGLAITAYLQWLGNRLDESPYSFGGGPGSDSGPPRRSFEGT